MERAETAVLAAGLFLLLLPYIRTLPHLPAQGATPGAPAVVMSLGIFGLGALQHLPVAVAPLMRLLTVEALLVWAYLIVAFALALRHAGFRSQVHDPVGRFAVGTWVAATALVAVLFVQWGSVWQPFPVMLAGIVVVLWLWFMRLTLHGLWVLASGSSPADVKGSILLATVATQSVVLLLYALFPGAPAPLSRGLIVGGYALYAAGLLLIAWHRWRRPHAILLEWDASYCIIHGAMSITGRAEALTASVPATAIALDWLSTLLVFVLIEALDIAHLFQRVRSYGWRGGIFDYHVSQWARVFTFGMFYAFTLALDRRVSVSSILAAWGFGRPVELIIDYGDYVVMAVLLAQIAVFLRNYPRPVRG